MFTQLVCAELQFAIYRKLYVAFIDIDKAFDPVNGNLLSDFKGVRLGSSILFSPFIDKLAVKVFQNGKHGVTLPMDYLELFTLLFADNVLKRSLDCKTS